MKTFLKVSKVLIPIAFFLAIYHIVTTLTFLNSSREVVGKVIEIEQGVDKDGQAFYKSKIEYPTTNFE